MKRMSAGRLARQLGIPKRRGLEAVLKARLIAAIVREISRRGLTHAVLAARCGLSTDHLIRLFRRHLGQTPGHYVQERRLAAAARDLVHSDDSIDAVAERHGFANRFYFTRVFTRRMGQAPATWRKHQQEAAGRR